MAAGPAGHAQRRGELCPAFLRDGSQIVFHSTRNGTRDIYLINTDGSGEQRLTSDSAESSNAAFSPDGLRIAYTNQGNTLYLLERASRTAPWQGPTLAGTPGTIVKGFAGMAEWAPDGREIYYVAPVGSTLTLFGIYRVAFTGGTPQLLVRFDAPQLRLHPGSTLTVRNGIVLSRRASWKATSTSWIWCESEC